MKRTGLLAIGVLTLVSFGTAHAKTTPEQKCQTAKLKARGKLQTCLKKQRVNVIVGKLDESAECQAQFTGALGKADTKASAAGTSCRYIDNGDGTVSDLNTGLMWEKKDDSGGIHDKDRLYTWSSSSAANGTAFTSFLGGLNTAVTSNGSTTSGCFAGHCDWRLPTMEELLNILLAQYPCSTHPCIDSVFGPTLSEDYWSAITDASLSTWAWSVYFSGGNRISSLKTNSHYVRAVRGGL